MQAKLPSPFISLDLLEEIKTMKRDGAGSEDVIDRLRLRCVPPGYIPKPWSQGMCLLCCKCSMLSECTRVLVMQKDLKRLMQTS